MLKIVSVVSLLWAIIGCGAIGEPAQSDFFSGSREVPPATNRYMVNLRSVVQLDCGSSRGTGSIIGNDMVLTAAHVVGPNTFCEIEGRTATVTEVDHGLDFAIMRYDTPPRGQRFPISCEGFVANRTYQAIGYAHGLDFVVTSLRATGRYDNGTTTENTALARVHVLEGQSYRGMSGGPIVDSNGVQVGTVIAISRSGRHMTFAREIKDTSLCGRR